MTSIIRKENIVCTDSLIFNGGPSSISLEYQSKFKRNKLGTCLIIFCGESFNGSITKLLEQVSNVLYNAELNDIDLSLKSFDEEFIKLLNYSKTLNEINLIFLTKRKSYVFKTYLEDTKLFEYPYNELVHLGTGSSYLVTVDLKDKEPLELMIDVINNVPSCNGTINLFDLNDLKDL